MAPKWKHTFGAVPSCQLCVWFAAWMMAGCFDRTVLQACQWNELCVQMSNALITQSSLFLLIYSFKFDTKQQLNTSLFRCLVKCLSFRFQHSKDLISCLQNAHAPGVETHPGHHVMKAYTVYCHFTYSDMSSYSPGNDCLEVNLCVVGFGYMERKCS